MARIQQSIGVEAPVHQVYQQLTQFEDYPRFMQEVDIVQQRDPTHLHWIANMSYQTLEWDMEITEQYPDRCIAWRAADGPVTAARVELEAAGVDRTQLTMTMECDPLQLVPAQDGNADTAVARQLEQDLARFKALVETPVPGADAGSDTANGRNDSDERALHSSGQEHAGVNTPIPVVSGMGESGHAHANGMPAPGAQQARSTQPANSLSGAADAAPEQPLSVAEDQGFDQQSAQARRVGAMPQDAGSASAMAQSMQQDKDAAAGPAPADNRSVPPKR
jgi:uncharacterized membrane protein